MNNKRKDTKIRENPYLNKIYGYNVSNDDENWTNFYNYVDEVSDNIGDISNGDDLLDFIYKTLNDGGEKFLCKKKEFGGLTQGKKKKFIPKIVRSLLRRKAKLSKRMYKSKSWIENQKVFEEMEEIEEELKIH